MSEFSSNVSHPVRIDGAASVADGAAVPVAPSATPLGRADRTEWPTLALAGGIYAGWGAATLAAGLADVPLWIWAPVAAWCVAWQTSLQHEVIHGHPTGHRWINRLVAGPPLVLWLVFDRYRRTHLAHHRDERLTDPIDDPESFYLTREAWQHAGPAHRCMLWIFNTLAGRLVVGPLWVAGRFLADEARCLAYGDPERWRVWGRHGLQLVLVSAWLAWICGIPVWLYALAVAWPATGLMLLRSFAEHRPAQDPAHRTAIVEGAGPLAWLYLANNLHALHHERPGLPWYALPKVYHANREAILARNGGFVLSGYGDVARRWLLRPRDHPCHPGHQAQGLPAAGGD